MVGCSVVSVVVLMLVVIVNMFQLYVFSFSELYFLLFFSVSVYHK